MTQQIEGFGFVVPEPKFRSGSPDASFSNEDIIEAAFQHFRKLGFPYRNLPVHTCMQEINKLAKTSNQTLLLTNTGYWVADTYHPHRFHSRHHNMSKSPFDRFQEDDRLRAILSKSLLLSGKIGKDWAVGLSWAGACRPAWNFRPGFALFMYRKYCGPGAVVLDTSTGYGGRLVGFMASQCSRYIGVDPNTLTYAGNCKLAKDMGREKDVELICLPAEDVKHSVVKNRCDFAFTSPPYFANEIYSNEDTQSSSRYQTGDDWRKGFLVPMLKLQFAALKKGSYNCVNIAGVKVKGNWYPLTDWTIEDGQAIGFRYLKTKSFELHRHFGKGGEKNYTESRTEDVIVFKKD